MSHERLYRVTSIGRPLEWRYPTNRAVLILVPVAAVIAAAVAAWRGDGAGAVGAQAFVGAFAAFGGWALARELAPDHNPAAFVSMVFAFVTSLVIASPSLLVLFTTLALVRVVNRTTGLAARFTDSIAVLSLTLVTAWLVRSPGLPVAAAVAFGLDAFLEKPIRHQLVFAALALAGAVLVIRFGPAVTARDLSLMASAAVGIVSVGFGIAIARTKAVHAVGDTSGVPLSIERVRAGMFVGLLVAVAALAPGLGGLHASALVWATLAGVAVGRGVRSKE